MENIFQLDEIIRGVRQRKKQSDPICCPVCSVTVRPNEIEQHLSLEMDRLNKVHGCNSKTKRSTMNNNSTANKEQQPSCSTKVNQPMESTDPKECWNTYQKIKNNRQARLKIKTRKRKADDPVCPVCKESFAADEIDVHVEICLRRPDASDDESIDVEADESYEEYEWAGQTRIRASSMLEGGFSASGIGSSVILNSNNVDEDEDLNVDGDDTQVYGQPQYTEFDVIVPTASNKKKQNEDLYLRKLVGGGEEVNSSLLKRESVGESAGSTNGSSSIWGESSSNNINNSITADDEDYKTTNKITTTNSSSTDGQLQIIESLKEKIREYELHLNSKCKCLICMDEFRIPVVSICCWHVHCEECWLRTLGARKLCPQCNMITSPSDLRRIYM